MVIEDSVKFHHKWLAKNNIINDNYNLQYRTTVINETYQSADNGQAKATPHFKHIVNS